MPRLVIALGGNAIKQAHETGTAEEQFHNILTTCQAIARIVENMTPEDRLIVTHGNGPQSGNLSVQMDMAKEKIPVQPLDVIGAMTQGQIGYMLQSTLQNLLLAKGIKTPVVALVNHVLVNKEDPEFEGENASKPVGNFLTEEEAMEIKETKGWIVKKVKPTAAKPWRRVVPSPDPIGNVEAEAINVLVDAGVIVIASGGGGIPVYRLEDGTMKGVEAVIDKDLSGERLGECVKATQLMILTDVEQACVDFGKPTQRGILNMKVEDATGKYKEHFLAGSMGPKVRACVRFLEWGGEKAIITSLEKALEALKGETGTTLTL